MRHRRIAPWLVIVPYVVATIWCFARHADGRPVRHPFGYFWTWDMFPNYPTERVRRFAIGERANSDLVFLQPDSLYDAQFHWGVNGDVTRIDLDGRLPYLREYARWMIDRDGAAGERRIIRVWLGEFWMPLRFNLPPDLYEREYGELHPWRSNPRSYSRIFEALSVQPDGSLSPAEALP